MIEKTTAWTPEELAEMRRQRAEGERPKWLAPERKPPHCNSYACRRYLSECACDCSVCDEAMFDWEGHLCPDEGPCRHCEDQMYCCGAAVMGGLLLMAEAIRETHGHVCHACGSVTWWPERPCQCWNDE